VPIRKPKPAKEYGYSDVQIKKNENALSTTSSWNNRNNIGKNYLDI